MTLHGTILHDDLLRRIRRLSARRRVRPTGLTPRLTPLPGIRAVLFDVYGTLLISGAGDPGGVVSDNQAGALQAALAAAGVRDLSPQAGAAGMALFHACIRASHAVGRRAGRDWPEVDLVAIWRRTLARLAGAGLIAAEVSHAQVKIVAVEYECRNNPVWPMPGMGHLLRRLARKKLALGIVSNAQFFTPLLFDAFFPGGLPALGIPKRLSTWSWTCGSAKPSPALFQLAINRVQAAISCRPAEILVVGNDMLNDVSGAARLGCATVLFAGDARSLRLRDHGREDRLAPPDAIITRLEQLAQLLP